MATLAIIGGTGITRLAELSDEQPRVMTTPYGAPSAPLLSGSLVGLPIVFLARHGERHSIPPHRINYRANLWAIKEAGVRSIVAIAAVGGIGRDMSPAMLAVPDQIVDYTWGRDSTFFDGEPEPVTHVDFTWPYAPGLRRDLLDAAGRAGVTAVPYGTYGCTQGPRLETAAEIERLERDGCHLVGMTGMPEAALARELGIDYAALAVVANWGAGKGVGEITMGEIEANLAAGMTNAVAVIKALAAEFARR